MVRVLPLNIVAEFEEPVDPRFPEALVRRGLGYTIRKMVCINKRLDECSDCLIKRQCLYSLMYDETGKTYKGLQVSPFSVNCKLDDENLYVMSMRFVLFQPLISYAGHLVYALTEAGRNGIGKSKKRFHITGVKEPSNGTLFPLQKAVADIDTMITEYSPDYREEEESGNECTVRFLTPARIRRKDRMKTTVNFHDLVKSCIMRYKNLERAFSDENTQFSLHINDILRAADSVAIVDESLEWERKERYSRKFESVLSVGGFTGEIRFQGPVRPFHEFLGFGSAVGIGKNTTFGCGQYIVDYKE